MQIVKLAMLPHLTYCQLIWQFCRAADARKLQKLQERAQRAVYCNKGATYEKLLCLADLPTLRNRRLRGMASAIHKVKNDLSHSYIANLSN